LKIVIFKKIIMEELTNGYNNLFRIEIDGKLYYKSSELVRLLGYRAQDTVRITNTHCSNVLKAPIKPGGRELNLIDEDDMYSMIFNSRREEAKLLKKSIKNILKSIRKTGGYSVYQNEELLQEVKLLNN